MNPSITLLQGMETEQTIDKVLAETRIKSEDVIAALKLHFVNGWAAPMAYSQFNVPQQNFDRAVSTLNGAYRKIESDVIENISLRKVA